MITFNSIPLGLRVPGVYTEIDSSRAQQGLNPLPYTALLLGQKTSAGSAGADTLVLVTSAEQAEALAGPGSILHLMAIAWFANNSFTPVYLGVLEDDGAGVAAEGTITISGTVTAAGTLSVYIAGQLVDVAVAAAQSVSDTATALAAAITALTSLPVTAAAEAGEVTLTAKNAGLLGNGIDVRVNYQDGDALPAGMAVAIVAMANGTTAPDLTALIAEMGDTWYQVIGCPYTDATTLAALQAELESRDGPLRQIPGIAFSAATGNLSTLTTLGSGRNDKTLSILPATGSPSLVAEWAAAYAAVIAYYGEIDPARPFQTLQLSGVLAPAVSAQFTLAERNTLLLGGVATWNADSAGRIRLERAITTYVENAASAPDTAFLDVNTSLTLIYIRYDFRATILGKYPRHKLANDGTRYGIGQKVITPKVGKAEAMARFRLWEEQGLVEGFEQFRRELIVERNVSDPNRLDFMLPTDVMNQFRVAGVQIQFLL